MIQLNNSILNSFNCLLLTLPGKIVLMLPLKILLTLGFQLPYFGRLVTLSCLVALYGDGGAQMAGYWI